MIVTAPNLIASTDSAVEVLNVEPGERSLLRLVAQEHPQFLRYYESPTSGTTLCSVQHAGDLVGGVLLEREPAAAESDRDAALVTPTIRPPHRVG